MGVCSCLTKWASALFLIAINLVLALGGALVLWVGIYMHNSGWVDVIKGYWSGMDDVVTTLIVIGGVVLGLAALGCIAALCRWRAGLTIYSIVVLLVFLLFVLVLVCAFLLRHRAHDWDDKAYPASGTEETVKTDFDEAYCYAQGEYICNDASVADALTMFAPDLNSSIVSLFKDYDGGVNALCDEYLDDYDLLQDVCDGCDIAEQFENFSSLVDWTNDKCAPTSENLIWCGVFLATGSTNSSEGTAPYSECRGEFLDLVADYSLYLAIGCIIVCVGALMVIIAACCLRRKQHKERRETDNSSYAAV